TTPRSGSRSSATRSTTAGRHGGGGAGGDGGGGGGPPPRFFRAGGGGGGWGREGWGGTPAGAGGGGAPGGETRDAGGAAPTPTTCRRRRFCGRTGPFAAFRLGRTSARGSSPSRPISTRTTCGARCAGGGRWPRPASTGRRPDPPGRRGRCC